MLDILIEDGAVYTAKGWINWDRLARASGIPKQDLQDVVTNLQTMIRKEQ